MPEQVPDAAVREIHSLRELSPQQWKSGIAAWLGWLFDGLDMHLYTLIAAPFVVALALACGFALGRLMPRADDFFSPEDARDLRQRVWERHWAENAARGDEHAARMASGAFDMGLGHTHTDH